jgi:hypothetical protein
MLLHVFQNVKNTKLFTKESCSIQKDSQNFKKFDYNLFKNYSLGQTSPSNNPPRLPNTPEPKPFFKIDY